MNIRSAIRCTPAGVCFIAVFLGLLAVGRSRMMRDPGTLWHTVVGERMLSEAKVLRADPFSFTHGGEPWVAQQWLGECAMAWLHRLTGLDGLLAGACLTLAFTFSVIAGRASRTGLSWLPVLLLIMILMAAASYHFIPRPHLATLLFMTLGTALLCDIESGRTSRHTIWLVPPAMLLWTNLHGGALGGIASLVLVALGMLLRPRWMPRLQGRANNPISPGSLAAVVGLSAAAMLISPFGAELPTVWISLMGSDVLPRVIIEHAPTKLVSVEGTAIIGIGAGYLALLASVWKGGIRVTWLLPIVWFGLALSRVRHGPIFALVAAIVMLDMLPHSALMTKLARFGRPGHAPIETPGNTPRHSLARFAMPALVVGVTFAFQASGIRCPVIGSNWTRLDPAYWPVEAATALRDHLTAHPEDNRVFNDMRFGGYLIYSTPEARIYIDDRCELYRDPGINRYMELIKYPGRFDGEAAYTDIRTAMVFARSPLARSLTADPRWRLIHGDKTAMLFVRNPAFTAAHR